MASGEHDGQRQEAPCPLDRVNRQFHAPAPNQLWVSDFTYVATWAGFVYVAFVIDVFARRIVGWRVSRSAHASFVLDALEQALLSAPAQQGRPGPPQRSRHRNTSIRYTERLAEAGIEPSVGSVGDSYDNALAETINGLYKTEVIHRRGPWRSFEAVEFATLEWVDWFNNRRLLEPIGNIPPAEAEALLRHAGRDSDGRVTQTKTPPANPGRFRLSPRTYLRGKDREERVEIGKLSVRLNAESSNHEAIKAQHDDDQRIGRSICIDCASAIRCNG